MMHCQTIKTNVIDALPNGLVKIEFRSIMVILNDDKN